MRWDDDNNRTDTITKIARSAATRAVLRYTDQPFHLIDDATQEGIVGIIESNPTNVRDLWYAAWYKAINFLMREFGIPLRNTSQYPHDDPHWDIEDTDNPLEQTLGLKQDDLQALFEVTYPSNKAQKFADIIYLLTTGRHENKIIAAKLGIPVMTVNTYRREIKSILRDIANAPQLEQHSHICPNCGTHFSGSSRKVYCSDRCKKSAQNRRHYQKSAHDTVAN